VKNKNYKEQGNIRTFIQRNNCHKEFPRTKDDSTSLMAPLFIAKGEA